MNDFDDMIRSNILELLRSTGTSNYRLSKETGISQGSISNYLSGKRSPSAQNLCKISDFFDVSMDVLCGRRELSDDEILHAKMYRSEISPGSIRREMQPVEYMLVSVEGGQDA